MFKGHLASHPCYAIKIAYKYSKVLLFPSKQCYKVWQSIICEWPKMAEKAVTFPSVEELFQPEPKSRSPAAGPKKVQLENRSEMGWITIPCIVLWHSYVYVTWRFRKLLQNLHQGGNRIQEVVPWVKLHNWFHKQLCSQLLLLQHSRTLNVAQTHRLPGHNSSWASVAVTLLKCHRILGREYKWTRPPEPAQQQNGVGGCERVGGWTPMKMLHSRAVTPLPPHTGLTLLPKTQNRLGTANCEVSCLKTIIGLHYLKYFCSLSIME